MTSFKPIINGNIEQIFITNKDLLNKSFPKTCINVFDDKYIISEIINPRLNTISKISLNNLSKINFSLTIEDNFGKNVAANTPIKTVQIYENLVPKLYKPISILLE